jgi:hypothetical protein
MADTTNPTAKSILALEHEFGIAEVNRDLRRMAFLMTDDLTDIEDDGTLPTKTDVLKLFRWPLSCKATVNPARGFLSDR